MTACAGLVLVVCAGASAQQKEIRPNPVFQRTIRDLPTQAFAQGPASRMPTPEELAAVEIDRKLLALIERLGDPSFAERERATMELAAASFDLMQLWAALAREPLTAEQRHRLLAVAMDQLINAPRGAVGIKVDTRFLPDKIVIEQLLPDLPARRVLMVGDRITHLEGKPLGSWDQFVTSVQTQEPGTTIKVTVERVVDNGQRADRLHDDEEEPVYETLDLDLTLGSAELLRDPISGRPQAGGGVLTARQQTASDARREYGPRAKVVRLVDG